MNFDFSDDQKLLQKTARDFLEERSPLAVNRNVLESDLHYDADLWSAAAEMGWQGATIPEEYGGAGFGYLELVLIAEEVGRSLAPIPFDSSVYLATEAILLAGNPEQKKNRLSALAAGEAIGTLALAEGRGEVHPNNIETRFEGGKLTGTKLAVANGNTASFAIVAAKAGDGVALALVDLSADGVTRSPVDSIDPTRSIANIEFKNTPAEPLGDAGQGWEVLQRVLDRGAIMLAFEQLGGASHVLELTKDFTMGRYAFGRPIASFQAIKHRLADLYAAVELAKSNCFYGAWALSTDSDELGIAACNARVSASTAFDLGAVEMIQMYGGVGYTWEYDCHLFYRRAKHDSVVLGSPAEWREKLVQRLVAKNAA
ncbi:MAG: acyl-CoA/acyl-ACP dehydrogenase [bacterium]|nr:acyl-CoA/acyl-ACP dehydrogenase [bacterium]